MKKHNYTKVKNVQIVLSLLKAKGIKRVIVSPGTTNLSIVGSMMSDPYFEMYSAPDERSAAYMACGMASENGEPVVLSCTGATASRNYLPGLTEAYYRKLPILALTSSLSIGRSGHLYPQFIDRTEQPKDCVNYSTQIFPIHCPEDEWNCIIKVNEALLELNRKGGGPVHINLMIEGEFSGFDEKELPSFREIKRYRIGDELPAISASRIAVFVGSHKKFTKNETFLIEKFCEKYNSVVFCDHTSSYYGKYRIQYSIVAAQEIDDINITPDILIHIGEVSGDYYTIGKLRKSKTVWRVSPDGEIRDYFRRLTKVFEMEESDFFEYYAKEVDEIEDSHFMDCSKLLSLAYKKLPDIPFSNIWIAQQLHNQLPVDSIIHFGILNSLRAWNFFPLPKGVESYCNVGGFGIDGALSTLIGASLMNSSKLYFGVMGDLAFFYDMNSLGNRHVGKNLRIIMVNNGKGTEFRNYTHPASAFGDEADEYIAAARHYGNQSPILVKNYAESLGFTYVSAKNKKEFVEASSKFLKCKDSSVIFEVFTNSANESLALKAVRSMMTPTIKKIRHNVAAIIKGI